MEALRTREVYDATLSFRLHPQGQAAGISPGVQMHKPCIMMHKPKCISPDIQGRR
jgi:hypothetical protein